MSANVPSPVQVTDVAPPSASASHMYTPDARPHNQPPSLIPLTHDRSIKRLRPVMKSPKTPVTRPSIKKPLKYKPRSGDGNITPQGVKTQLGRPSKKLGKKSTVVPKQEKAAPRKRRRGTADPNGPPPRRSARIAEKTATRLSA